MKTSIIMTVCDREPEVLMNTLRWLGMDQPADTEIVIVDDGSSYNYAWLEPYLKNHHARMVRLEPYACYSIHDNYNNPAKAFNHAALEAQGERVIILSSDVIVPPRVLAKALKFAPDETIFCPMVIDLATGGEYCGPNRTFPMPWFLSTSKKKIEEAGGWDENYLLGMCFEDNDFVARLALVVGSVTYDWNCIVWHQSHVQPAYSDDQWVRVANTRNRVYTADKWAGIPFDPALGQVWEIERARHECGDVQWRFKDSKGCFERVRAATLSPFVEVPA